MYITNKNATTTNHAQSVLLLKPLGRITGLSAMSLLWNSEPAFRHDSAIKIYALPREFQEISFDCLQSLSLLGKRNAGQTPFIQLCPMKSTTITITVSNMIPILNLHWLKALKNCCKPDSSPFREGCWAVGCPVTLAKISSRASPTGFWGFSAIN